MMFQPDQTLRSLILVSWPRADYTVHELASGLRLGLTGCRSFLTRRAASTLRIRLVRLETLARRLLVLLALDSPLPNMARRAGQGAPVRGPTPAAPTPCPFLTPPVFRLAEPRPRTATPHLRPRIPRTLRPRLLYLDQPLPPPEPGEYPFCAEDLIPAAWLVRRARALLALFDDPAHPLPAWPGVLHVTGWIASGACRSQIACRMPRAAVGRTRLSVKPFSNSTTPPAWHWRESTHPDLP